MNRRRLDEMQVQKRSVIGSQTFIMLLLLLLDICSTALALNGSVIRRMC